MPDAIVYCDGCSRMILPSEMKSGDAVVTAATSLCPDCARALGADERGRLEARSANRAARETPGTLPAQPIVQGRTRHHRKTAGEPGREGKPAGRTSAVVAAVAIAVVTALLVAVAGTSMWRRTTPAPGPPDRPLQVPAAPVVTAPAATPPAAPAPTPAAAAAATPAAQQLAKIRSMLGPDLSRYDEIRRMLVQFPTYFGREPEAKEAQALLFVLDTTREKQATEALAFALESARASASRGEFDEGILQMRSVESRFGEGPWYEATGRTAIASAIDRLRTEADGIAEAAGRRRAADAAVRGHAAERDAFVDGFCRLMAARDFAAARTYAASKTLAGDAPGADVARAAARVVGYAAGAVEARLRGARSLVGREARLRLTAGYLSALVKDAGDTGLTVATTFTINDQTREKTTELKWAALHDEQVLALVRLGGLEADATDAAIAAACEALAADDVAAAAKAVRAAGDNPLAGRLAAVVRDRADQLACDAAIAEAEALVAKKHWKEALGRCTTAVALRPADPKAAALLVTIRRQVEPDLVLHYAFDETSRPGAKDDSPGANAGTIPPSVAFVPTGRFGGAFRFEVGSESEVVRRAAPVGIDIAAGGLTVSFWIRTNVVGKAHDNSGLLQRKVNRRSGEKSAWRVTLGGSDEVFFAYTVEPGEGDPAVWERQFEFSGEKLPADPDAWTHVAFTLSADRTVGRQYWNGGLKKSKTFPAGETPIAGTTTGDDDRLDVGVMQNGFKWIPAGATNHLTTGWYVDIDDVRIYSCALPDAEIQALYQGR